MTARPPCFWGESYSVEARGKSDGPCRMTCPKELVGLVCEFVPLVDVLASAIRTFEFRTAVREFRF
jgi:hypothetical protein